VSKSSCMWFRRKNPFWTELTLSPPGPGIVMYRSKFIWFQNAEYARGETWAAWKLSQTPAWMFVSGFWTFVIMHPRSRSRTSAKARCLVADDSSVTVRVRALSFVILIATRSYLSVSRASPHDFQMPKKIREREKAKIKTKKRICSLSETM